MTTFPDLPDGTGSLKVEIFNPSDHQLPFRESDASSLVEQIETGESVQFVSVEIVFTDEDGIVNINSEYLDRDYITDIISFRLDDNESNQAIEGVLYCCAPRIAEQSADFDSDPETEFLRIIVHGLLHLTGYDDQTDSDKAAMTALENRYLQSLSS